jgi:hypothetical protein
MRRKGDPGAPPVDEKFGPPVDYATYSVLAFKLHKFDVSGKFKVAQVDTSAEANKSESELLKNPLV